MVFRPFYIFPRLVIGFDRRVWQVAEGWNQFPPSSDEISITFTYVSEDGEENFPGELHVCMVYVCVMYSIYYV